MPPSRNDLWFILVIAGLCAAAAGFVYFNNSTRSTNRVLRQQTTALLSQLAQVTPRVASAREETDIVLAHASELKSIIRQFGSLTPINGLPGLPPRGTISTQDIVGLRQLDALRVMMLARSNIHSPRHVSFVRDTRVLKYFANAKEVQGVQQVDVNGGLIIDFGCTNYFDLLSEGIIPLSINGCPFKTDLRIDATR